MAGPYTMGFTWDTKDPVLWDLKGLPLVMSQDESLTLPMMTLSVVDAQESGRLFESGEKCTLVIRLAIRTDSGNPSLPDQAITITKSGIGNSLMKLFNGQSEPEENSSTQ